MAYLYAGWSVCIDCKNGVGRPIGCPNSDQLGPENWLFLDGSPDRLQRALLTIHDIGKAAVKF